MWGGHFLGLPWSVRVVYLVGGLIESLFGLWIDV
jgi:hypothetical protein